MGIKMQYAEVLILLRIRLDNSNGNRVFTSKGDYKLIVFKISVRLPNQSFLSKQKGWRNESVWR